MAKRITTTIVDDLDGSIIDNPNLVPTRFALNGTDYEIDLTEAHRDAFMESLLPYLNAAAKVPPPKNKTRSSDVKESRSATNDIRQWASENGYAVASRGRIAHPILQAYIAAHQR